MMDLEEAYRQAADAILAAHALLIGAGAGMGVNSGLPDFRGPEGFWRAYPAFHGQRFEDISNPVWFKCDPEQAWGFFGHRLDLYRATAPHAGFEIVRRWGESRPQGYFVFTSNVDGHFHRAGFAPDRIMECHGSIHFLQCVDGCTDAIWSADEPTCWSTRTRSVLVNRCRSVSAADSWPDPTSSCSTTANGYQTDPKGNSSVIVTGSGRWPLSG